MGEIMSQFRNRLLCTLPTVLIVLIGSGCVERRFVLESSVPGAQVYVNNVPIGPSPSDARWEYPGEYEFRVVAPGYEPLTVRENVEAKWYEYPGLDFFFEVLWPWHIEDVRRYNFMLTPLSPVRTDELLDSANQLRERARMLPPPEQPDIQPGSIVPTVIPPDGQVVPQSLPAPRSLPSGLE